MVSAATAFEQFLFISDTPYIVDPAWFSRHDDPSGNIKIYFLTD
jgi:hypothetical protein